MVNRRILQSNRLDDLHEDAAANCTPNFVLIRCVRFVWEIAHDTVEFTRIEDAGIGDCQSRGICVFIDQPVHAPLVFQHAGTGSLDTEFNSTSH